MKKNRYEEGRFSDRGHGLGTITREMVESRAQEIAVISGRSKDNVLSTDLEQARRELSGEERLNPPETPGELLPEDQRWTGTPDNTGEQVEPVPAPDEQTFAEKLVEEGVEDAEHDQMIKATRASLKRDRLD